MVVQNEFVVACQMEKFNQEARTTLLEAEKSTQAIGATPIEMKKVIQAYVHV